MTRILRITLILTALFATTHFAQAQSTAVASGNWSSAATWGGTVPTGAETDIVIPMGIDVLLDADVECGELLVQGRLEVQRADRTLTCDSLIVMGANAEFEVGTDANRFTDRFVLTLKGETTEKFIHHSHDMGARALLAMMGGTITMHGEDRVEWTRLGASVAASATSITMSEAVDWRAGDDILICSSRLDWNEAEKMQVASVTGGGLTVNLTSALAFPHLGVIKTYTRPSDSKEWTGDMRAEVGLLSRNITIQGAADSETSGFGAHVMVHGPMTVDSTTHPSGEAYVKGVEIFRGGQKSLLARYPFHWHLCEDAGAGQYFNDNSVHLSFNRAITIHGTDFATVENNFCYDHIGHGLFLEDGVERFNVIRRNVLVLTKRPAAGEQLIPSDNSDNEAQNRTPASYWITNPRNTFEDNVAAGTEGTAYWFIMPTGTTGPSASRAYYNGARPNREPLESFARNSAHSCMNGFDIFDILNSNHSIQKNGGWNNATDHVMDSCTFYANDTALYAGIGISGLQDNVIYRNNVFIDNKIVTMLATYNVVDESVIVADSGEGLFTAERKLFRAYDGAGQIRNCHLIGWNASDANLLMNTGGAIKHVNNRFAGITTDHAGTVRASMTDFDLPQQADAHANHVGHPRFWSIVLRDEDGSLSGVPDSSIISNHRFMRVGDETQPANWTRVYSSPHHFVTAIEGAAANNVSVKRSKAGTPNEWVYYNHGYQEHHQLPVIVSEDFLYTYYYESLPSSRRTDFRIDDATAGDTVVARFKDFGKLPGVSVNTTSHASLAALNASGSTGYYVEANGDLYLKMVATGKNQSRRVSWSSNPAWNEWDSDGDGLTDGTEAAIASRDPFSVTDLAAQFDSNGDFEQWDQLNNITGGQVTGGSLIGTSTGDSQIINGDFGFAATDISVVILRFKATVNTAVELFWERSNAAGFSGTRHTQVDYTTAGAWQILFIPVDSHAEWNDTITGLRIDPIAGAGDFEIDWIRASNGDADGDGIPDMTEGFGDIDGDGLANLDDVESDGDGTSDAAENAAGRDPYDAGDLRFKFNTDGDLEGWSLTRISGSVTGGLISGTATGPQHPNIFNTGFRFAAGSVTDILIRLRVSSTRSIPLLFGTDTANSFSGTRRFLDASPSANQWGMVSFPVSTHADWNGFITRLRFDPTLAGATLDVDWVLATDGDRDDDGLTDAAEGHEDADNDGSPNLDDKDSDGDGAPDAIESSFGRNPYANVEGGQNADGDGQTDLFEMITGFSPVSSGSFFSQSTTVDPNGDRRITFSAKPNRTYKIERSRDLAAWQQIGQVLSGATDGNLDHVDAEMLATGPVHYRLIITVADGESATTSTTMSLTINQTPVATAQSVSLNEDVPTAITLTGSDPDMDPLAYFVATSPSHGTLTGSAPNLTYTPHVDYHGPDSFTFRANDGIIFSSAATVTITVSPVPDPPVAIAQNVSVNEDNSLPITLTGSDGDLDPLTFAVVTPPAQGSLSGTAPNLTYTPNANYHGPDSFTFKVNDGSTDSLPATISITVDPVNDPPVATAQSASVNEDASRAITLAGSDIENDPLTFAVATGPSHGSLSGTAPNLTYTPNADYFGPDSFTFKANDGTVDSAPATVSLTVDPLPDVPMATAQSVNVDEDNSLAVTLTGSDVDNDPLTYAVATPPTHGILSGTAPSLTYTPNADYHGPDSFTFTANDGRSDSAAVTVSITVNPVNDAPVAAAQSVNVNEDASLAVTLTGSDIDNDPLTYAVATPPTKGTLSGTAPNLTYTPNADYFGPDSFTFTANDGTVDSAAATVSITVNPVNDAPVAAAQSVNVNEDDSLAVALTGSDIDNNPLTYAVATPPTKGTLSGTAPNLTYTPNADYFGPDSFTFTANDGTVDSAAATVSITVNPVPDVPVAATQSVNVDEDDSRAITLTGSDVDNDPLTYAVATPPTHGNLSGSEPNLTYTPNSDYHGPDSFTFMANDGTADSSVATVSITVNPVNDAPVAATQNIDVNEDDSRAITLTGSDIDNDPLTYAVATPPTHGTLSGTAPSLTYTPNADYFGPDGFTFTANDGTADSPAATVSIAVNPLPDAPVAPDATFTLNEGSPAGTPVGSVNGSDPDAGDNGAISYIITGGNSSRAFAINPANGDLTVSSSVPLDFETNPIFALSVLVEDLGTPRLNATATITITLNDLNEPPTVGEATFGLNENSPVATPVGTVVGSDVDAAANGTVSYAIIAGNASGAFAIANDGALTVADAGPLDFETAPNFTLTVEITDGGAPALTDTAVINVNLTDVNEAPTLADVAFSIDENSSNSAAVATLAGADQDAGLNGAVSFLILTGNESGAFALDPMTGALSVADTSQLNFEANPAFSLTVGISDGGTPPLSEIATIVINLNDLNEAPFVGDATFAIDENSPNLSPVGTVTGSDVDSGVNGSLTYAISAGNDSGAFAIDSGSGAITIADASLFDFEANPVFALTIEVTDGGTPGLSDTANVTINLNDLNEAPTVGDATFAIDENSPNLSPVGATLGSDPDGGANGSISYAITAGNDSGAFAIASGTGAITIADTSLFDFEANPSFTLTVEVTDGGTPGLSDTANVTINLNDINETPSVGDATFAIDENRPNRSPVGAVTGSDVDGGVNGSLTYAITAGNNSGAFAIDSGTGAITIADASQFNFEANPSFTLTVEVTDGGTPGLSDTATLTINLNDLNEAPSVDDTTFVIDENSPILAPVGTVAGSDPDGGLTGTLTYAITAGNSTGAFAIDPDSGTIAIADATLLNFEATPSFTLSVQVTDGGTPGLTDSATVAINLNDLNEVPTVGDATFAIDENRPNLTTVGTLTGSDVDGGANGSLTYAITAGNGSGAFAMDSNSGALAVADATQLNFEAITSFSLTIEVTDGGTPGLSDTANVTVNLNDLNEAPAIVDQVLTVPENSGATTPVGMMTGTDADAGANGEITLAITGGNDSGSFAIDPNTGALTVGADAQLNFEVTPTYSLTVQAIDGGTPALTGTATITVNLTDLNEAPSLSDLSVTLPEDITNSAPVGMVIGTDPDTGTFGQLTYAVISGDDNGAFTIDPASGAITVADTDLIDFETGPAFSLIVQASDGGTPGLTNTATVSIDVLDVNEAPSVADRSFALDENSPGLALVGTVSAADEDAGADGTFTYEITGGNAARAFVINTSSGDISVGEPDAIDFESNPTFALTVTVTDGGTPAQAATATITINLNDLNEAPTVADLAASLDENSANSTTVDTLIGSDPDAGVNGTLSYAITAGNAAGAFVINPASGAVTVADTAQLDFEANPSFALTVTVTDGAAPALTNSATLTVNIGDLNEAPTAADLSFTLDENSSALTPVGTLIGSDPDAGLNGALIYAFTAGNEMGAFAINSRSGAISVADGAAIDFETNPVFNLLIEMTDGGTPGLRDTAQVTISLNDLNEAPTAAAVNFSLDENSPNSAIVGTVAGSDGDGGANGTLSYAITAGDTDGVFAIDVNSGTITVADATKLDFEDNNSFALSVTVTDGGTPALADTAVVGISLADLNEGPSLADSTVSLAENSPLLTPVGTMVGSDPDNGDSGTLVYAISAGNSAGAFTIDGNGGAVTVAATAPLDFEANQLFQLTVTATDGGEPTLADTAVLTINLTDRNEAPILADHGFRIDEDITGLSAVGTIAGTDMDSGTNGSLSYAIAAGDPSGAFAIGRNTGIITVTGTPPLDYESASTIALTVTATDGGNPALADSATITITLNDVNEPPTAPDASFTIAEHSFNGVTVGAVEGSDPDTGLNGSLRYELVGGSGSTAFTVNPINGTIVVADRTQLAFGINPTLGLTVEIKDRGTPALVHTASITINLTDINEAPGISAQSFSIDENSVAGTLVGTVVASDPDEGANQTLTYAITSGNQFGTFALDSGSGRITVANPFRLNFEARTNFTFTVTSTDGGAPALTDSALITVNLNNLDEAPGIIWPLPDLTVSDPSVAAVENLTLHFGDIETPAADLIYTVTANTNSALVTAAISNSYDLILTFAAGFSGTSLITVRATDPVGQFAEDSLVVTIPSASSPPRLQLIPGPGGYRLRWPSTETGWQVESTTIPAPATAWRSLALPQTTANGETEVDLEPVTTNLLYRLRRP